MNILDKNWWGSLNQMIEDLPENRALIKDSGLWSIRSEDLEIVYYKQDANETFQQFIERAYSRENIYIYMSAAAAFEDMDKNDQPPNP